MKRSLGIDPLSGVETFHDYDPLTDITHIQQVQDVEPILEKNKALANTDHSGDGIKNSWWHCAPIPNVIISKWLNEDGIDFFNKDHWEAVKRKLNVADYRYLRTGRGK